MRGLFWLTVWGIKVAVKVAGRWGRQLIDCVTVMKQTDVQLALSILLSSGTQPRRSCCLYSGSALPTYLNLSGNNAH